MTTSMLEFVLNHLNATKGRWPSIAQKTGVPYRTLQKIGQRIIENPGIDHVQKLHDYFSAHDDVAINAPVEPSQRGAA